jgi:succinyl-CoA synthetase beta subunit
MKIHEYQAKEIFAKYGIPVPVEQLALNPEQAVKAAETIGLPVMVKAQVLVGGRGKAGGVKKADTLEEVKTKAAAILGMNIKGVLVKKVLLYKARDIAQEFYLGITVDRRNRCPVMMVSAAGGVEIEEVARQSPELIHKLAIDPIIGLRSFEARNLGFEIIPDAKMALSFAGIAVRLARLFFDLDCSIAEINPLVITKEHEMIALDAKLVFDDNGLERHPELESLRDLAPDEEKEHEAKELGFSYIKLTGTVGCIVNGAGLAMATMDLIKRYGGEPANFLDIGGSSSPEKMANAMRILLEDKNVKSILINIFGGITRCDDVAQGLLDVTAKVKIEQPIVVRLTGTNEERARELLAGSHLVAARTMAEGVEKAIALGR